MSQSGQNKKRKRRGGGLDSVEEAELDQGLVLLSNGGQYVDPARSTALIDAAVNGEDNNGAVVDEEDRDKNNGPLGHREGKLVRGSGGSGGVESRVVRGENGGEGNKTS